MFVQKKTPEKDENSDASPLEDETISTAKPKLKRENAFKMPDLSSRRTMLLFTPEEDKYLKNGIKRHGFGNWTAIL